MNDYFFSKVRVISFSLFVFVLIAVAPFYSRAYDETHRIAVKMCRSGFIPSLSENADDEAVYDWISGYSTFEDAYNVALSVAGVTGVTDEYPDYSAAVPFLRSDMTGGFTEEGVFVFPDNLRSRLTDQGGSSLSGCRSAHVYELALRLLGYNSDDFGNSAETVISFAIDRGFGFTAAVSSEDTLTRGRMINIFYEALFLPAGDSGYSLIRLKSLTDPSLRSRFLELNMLDDFPESVPVYLSSPYKDESFTYVQSSSSLSSDRTDEWYALYLSSTQAGYVEYKSVLEDNGWTLEVEYERTGDDGFSVNSLYYKMISGKEQYILVSLFENTGIMEIWSGV